MCAADTLDTSALCPLVRVCGGDYFPPRRFRNGTSWDKDRLRIDSAARGGAATLCYILNVDKKYNRDDDMPLSPARLFD
jgi:hypothetical protein